MTKRILLIGINYRGTSSQLEGCINDAMELRRYLTTFYSVDEIEILTDNTTKKPTKSNILESLSTMISKTLPGDSLFIGYSGHGSHQFDISGDEEDGEDELLVPLDFRTSGMIVDDDISSILHRGKKNTKITCLFDSCHSGTVADLRYDYNNPTVKICESYTPTDADIYCFSGCKDTQYSYETIDIDNENQGKMTDLFVRLLTDNSPFSYANFLSLLKQKMILDDYRSQTPQFHTGKIIDPYKLVSLL